VEGAVGLAPRPQVRLYARGLPVWEGTTLEELSHTPPEESKDREFGQGLAPVFLLNGNRLEVNISRRKVIDNRHLQQVRKTAEKALSRMIENAADCVAPRGPLRRISDKFKYGASSLFRSIGKTLLLLLLVVVPLEIVLLKFFYRPSPETVISNTPVRTLSIRADGNVYTGASVNIGPVPESSGFTYSPPVNHWFTLYYAEIYDTSSGFLPLEQPGSAAPPSLNFLDCAGEGVSIQLDIREKCSVFLPQPLGYGVHFKSITVDASPAPMKTLDIRANGEIVLRLEAKGVVRYRCCLPDASRAPAPPRQWRETFTLLPEELQLPPALEIKLQQARDLGLTEKVALAQRLTNSLLKYDVSAETAKQYARSARNGDWYRRVMDIGRGDCDIINGVTVIFLRKMGVPARLVIGAVGRAGRILPVLHAWTEYYEFDGKRRVVDVSARTPHARSSGQNGPAAGTPVSSHPRTRDTDAARQTSLFRQTAVAAVVALTVLLIMLLAVLIARESGKRPHLKDRVRRQVEKDLAGMALHSLLHPNQGVWGEDSGIRTLKVIPTLNGKPVSIREALKLGKEQKLFSATADNPVFTYLERAGRSISVPVLDAGNAAFAPLIKLLPDAVHLEQVTALKAIPAEQADRSWIGQLVAAVNRLLKKSGAGQIPPCLLVSGRTREDLCDVDLSPLPTLPNWLMPNRFIAVNPYSRRLNAVAALYQENPKLAQFRFIDMLLKESRLVPVPATGIIERVSRQLLLEQAEV
jgi:hypothetical protein